jgi:hypothetical protein
VGSHLVAGHRIVAATVESAAHAPRMEVQLASLLTLKPSIMFLKQGARQPTRGSTTSRSAMAARAQAAPREPSWLSQRCSEGASGITKFILSIPGTILPPSRAPWAWHPWRNAREPCGLWGCLSLWPYARKNARQWSAEATVATQNLKCTVHCPCTDKPFVRCVWLCAQPHYPQGPAQQPQGTLLIDRATAPRSHVTRSRYCRCDKHTACSADCSLV